MINNNIIIIFVFFIIIIGSSIWLWYHRTNKSNDKTNIVKLENIKNTKHEEEMKEKNKLYNDLKRKINDIILEKYTFQAIKDNPKLKSNFESITTCILNKILKHIDIEKGYFDVFENFENLYDKIYKKDPTIYYCFNEKQLKAIKILRDRISNSDLESIIDYVKKNISSNFSDCKNNDCFSEKEYIILNNYK